MPITENNYPYFIFCANKPILYLTTAGTKLTHTLITENNYPHTLYSVLNKPILNNSWGKPYLITDHTLHTHPTDIAVILLSQHTPGVCTSLRARQQKYSRGHVTGTHAHTHTQAIAAHSCTTALHRIPPHVVLTNPSSSTCPALRLWVVVVTTNTPPMLKTVVPSDSPYVKTQRPRLTRLYTQNHAVVPQNMLFSTLPHFCTRNKPIACRAA